MNQFETIAVPLTHKQHGIIFSTQHTFLHSAPLHMQFNINADQEAVDFELVCVAVSVWQGNHWCS